MHHFYPSKSIVEYLQDLRKKGLLGRRYLLPEGSRRSEIDAELLKPLQNGE